VISIGSLQFKRRTSSFTNEPRGVFSEMHHVHQFQPIARLHLQALSNSSFALFATRVPVQVQVGKLLDESRASCRLLLHRARGADMSRAKKAGVWLRRMNCDLVVESDVPRFIEQIEGFPYVV
jgi:hypothetical protein